MTSSPHMPVSGTEPMSATDEFLASSLMLGRMAPVSKLFYDVRMRPPLVVWSPNRVDLPSYVLRDFLDYCESLMVGGGLPRADAFRLRDAPHGDWILLLENIGFGRDFRYLHYGAGIADYYGKSMQDRLVSEFQGHIGRFFLALYRAALHRREIVLSEHEPPQSVFVRVWQRLIVPLVDKEGYTERFAVLNLPDNQLRAGLEAVPFACIVVDADRVVRYANKAARDLRPGFETWEHGASIEALLGREVNLPESPVELLEPVPSAIHETAVMDLPDAPRTRVEIHIAATRYRDLALYVITVRELGMVLERRQNPPGA